MTTTKAITTPPTMSAVLSAAGGVEEPFWITMSPHITAGWNLQRYAYVPAVSAVKLKTICWSWKFTEFGSIGPSFVLLS